MNKLQYRIKKLFEVNRTASIIALSSAIGVFIGFSPYLGLHTVLAIAIAYVFNLPIYPLILGAYITNPITFIFIYAFCYKVGLWLTDINTKISIDWNHLTWHDLFTNVKGMLIPFFVGTHVVGVIASIMAYCLVYFVLKKYRGW
ncbi:conserved hypothetical protein [Deferribacter desulfuricans SSM1]|uniref:DUF2062 domain-containing protein n=1 Tax=Deferribacter desulfuricans (strain DSM 14783 / JCM 11476 / NBRC 101012 / SSM1) TaxID=639282 RepID=D3P8X1_DEFDS|nr:conserved hypothetical protein [Deferribacter desulfuricans SSM1]